MGLGFKLNSTTEKQLEISRWFMKRVMAMKDSKGRKLSKARVTLVGHSLGGFIAQVLAVEQAVGPLRSTRRALRITMQSSKAA